MEVASARICGSLKECLRAHGRTSAPYESVGLTCRYAADLARLELAGLPHAVGMPFASTTDLTTGLERAVLVHRAGDAHVVAQASCPPRTLLRICWRASR